MTSKRFLTSVGDVYAYDQSDNLLFVAKTMLDTSIETSLGNTEVRGGRGNQLQYMYYHTAAMNITLSDAQWNLDFLSSSIGEAVVTGANVYTEETVTLTGGGAGSVTGTPIAIQGTSIYGWVTLVDGTVERVTFSTKAFSCSGTSGDEVCVRYYHLNSAARSLTIPANIIPAVVRLVIVAQLNSSDVATNRIGEVQIVVERATLSGQFSIAMSPDGVANTPLTAMALAYTPSGETGCTNEPVYASIREVLDSANWYDNVVALSIQGGDFTLASGTRQLVVWAIPTTGAAFQPPVADLTFASSVEADATVDAAGLVTYVSSGSTVIKASITAVATIDANVVVTCS